jgi:hypothetical protein
MGDYMKVRLFSSEYTSEENKGPFRSWTDDNRTAYKDMEIVSDETYTHAVIIDNASPKLKNIPKKNVVGYCAEPYTISGLRRNVSYILENCGSYYVYDKDGFPEDIFKGGMGMLPPLPIFNDYPEVEKVKKMSFIVSDKNYLKGHKLRHELVKWILTTDLDIDIFGRGIECMYSDSRIKGSISHKKEALQSYQFSLCIENEKYDWYTSEKLYDCFLHDTIPLYWGARRITELFSSESLVNLPNDIEEIKLTIIDICGNSSVINKHPKIGKQELVTRTNWAKHIYDHFKA